ncbi:hypothetical protein DXV75_00735 [Alteromonas aestuariivivens]|uniref:Uncharacterized protein n=1 Tax=Alteromonas aestuariivivens TaxID=1938339 RepID=A0A3D8MEI5_9ALTE|nr:hypothetical protein DXV75_00735 [Alteromonas aestuariivivens]
MPVVLIIVFMWSICRIDVYMSTAFFDKFVWYDISRLAGQFGNPVNLKLMLGHIRPLIQNLVNKLLIRLKKRYLN